MSLADSLYGIHSITDDGGDPITRKTLNVKGSTIVTDEPELGRVTVEVSGGAIWHELLDLDFTAEVNQNLGADDDYTIGSKTWTKYDTANELADAEIVNGTGLILCPWTDVDGYQNPCTVPRLSIRIGDLFEDEDLFLSDTPILIMCRGYLDTGPGSGFSSIGVGVDYITGDVNVACATRLFSGGANQGGQAFVHHDTSIETVFGTTSVATTYDVPCLWMPNGIGGMSSVYGRGLWVTDWPEIPFLASWYPDSNWWDTAAWPGVGYARDWKLSVFAQTSAGNASYKWVVQNVRFLAFY